MIVNYDKENGFSSIFKKTKKEILSVSKEVNELFSKIDPGADLNVLLEDIFDASNFNDKNFNQWVNGLDDTAKSAMTAGDALESYKKHLQETSKATTKLASLKGIAKGALGFLGASALNIGASMAATYAIDFAIKKWDEYANAQEHAIEKSQTSLSKLQENQNKIKSAQSVLNDIQSNKVIDTNGNEITRFEQLSRGVNSLGENVSLTASEFEEYNSILNSISGAGLNATTSMANLEKQVKDLRRSANSDSLTGLGDWVEGFNAKNNQRYFNSTKEVGMQQKISALNKIYNDPKDANDKIEQVTQMGFWEKLANTYASGEMAITAGQTVSKEARESLLNSADKIREDIIATETDIKALEDIAKEYSIDIFDDKGKIDYSKYNSDKVQKQLADVRTNLETQVESMVRESSGFLQAMFENSPEFDKISNSAANAISGIFNNIDYDTIEKHMLDSNGNLSQKRMEDWVNNISTYAKNKGVQEKLSNLFNLGTDTGNKSFKEYENEVNNLLDGITKSLPGISKNLLKDSSGISDILEDASLAYERVKETVGKGFADTLSLANLDLAAEIISTKDVKNAQELRDAMLMAKQATFDMNANPVFDKITEAKESKNAGDDYVQATAYLKEAKEMFDKGLVGTDDFKSIAKYLSPTGSEDPTNFLENYGKAARYLTEDGSGVSNFLNDLNKKGYATFEKMSDGTKKWSYNIQDLQKASQDMGIGFEFMMDMFGRLEDYGFSNNFISSQEDGIKKITDKTTKLAQAKKELAEMETTGQYTTVDENGNKQQTVANKTAIDAKKAEITGLENDLNELQNSLNQFNQATADSINQQIEKSKQMYSSLKEERDKILSENRYGENTDEVIKGLDAQLKQIAQDGFFEIDGEMNIINENEVIEEIESNHVEIKATVDLTSRPKVKAEKMRESGWNVNDDEVATVFSSGYSNERGDTTITVTPILPNGEVLTQDELDQYANEILTSGKDEKGILIKAHYGKDSIEQSNRYAEALHNVQEAFYLGDEAQKSALNSLSDYSSEQLKSLDLTDDSADHMENALVSLMDNLGITKDSYKEFIDVMSDMNLLSSKFEMPKVEESTFNDLKEAAQESLSTVQQMVFSDSSIAKVPITLDLEADNAANIDAQIASIIASVDKLKNENGIIDISAPGAQDVINVLMALIARKQEIAQPVIMSVDTGKLDGDLATVIGKLQEFQTAYNELQRLNTLQTAGVNVDTSDAQTKLNNITSEIQNLDGKQAEIMATVVPDTSSVDSISSTISAMSPEMLVKVGVNPDAIANYTPEDKNANVNYHVSDSEIKSYIPPNKEAIVKYSPNTSLLPTSFPSITRTVNYIKGSDAEASGTMLSPAHVNGTAYNTLNMSPAHAGGNVAIQKDEKALVNELKKPESIVRDGIWSIIPGGAHVEQLKKGDIIFNGEQTEQLLKHGRIAGHGIAYADGTVGNVRDLVRKPLNAYAGGAGGGILGAGGSGSKANFGSSGKSNSTYKAAKDTKKVAKNTKDAADSAKEFEETLDHIETLVDRTERNIKNLERTATSTYETLGTRTDALKSELNEITKEIDIQSKAYDRYLQEVNSVGLSEDYAEKVRNGLIDIETITDEELNKSISSYKDYYEKALDCRDAVEELKESVKGLYEESFNNLVKEYGNMLAQIEHRKNILEGYIEQTETQGYIVSTKYYAELIKNEQSNLEDLTSKRNSLLASLNDAVANGNIKMYSESW